MTALTPHIVLAAGGTGGHLFPALSLATELRKRDVRVTVLTDSRGMNWREEFDQIELLEIRSETPYRRGILGKVFAGMTILRSVMSTILLLGRLRATVVVGFGGYPSFPPLLAAVLRGVRSCIHEQNGVMGRANKALAKRVDRIAVTIPNPKGMPESARTKQITTGNPVRSEVLEAARRRYIAPGDGTVRLLVFGGSQGATVFSEVVPKSLGLLQDDLRQRIRITQQCRSEDIDSVREQYQNAGIEAELASFFHDLPEQMAESHLIVSRSGASTVCELMVLGRPAIMVPLPQALDDDQGENARFLVEAGGGWLLRQQECTPERLSAMLTDLLNDTDALSNAAEVARSLGQPDAAVKLADLVVELSGRKEGG